MNETRWHTLADAQAVAEAVARSIAAQARSAIENNGAFKIVLAGGTTPGKVYERLAEFQTDWSCWHIYFGDERCLPADHPDRNSVMASRTWLERVHIPADHIHPIPAELGPVEAATAYEQTVARALPFDLVLLGMGEDGHTASLFPGQQHVSSQLVHPIFDAPKPPPQRVSLGLGALNDSHSVIILITGAAKRQAIQQWQSGVNLPIAAIHGLNGCDIYMDAAARP